MDKIILQKSITKFKKELFNSITTAKYNGKVYDNGQKAKEALIRSQSLIFNIHESVKKSFFKTLKKKIKLDWKVFPPLKKTNPELKIFGLLKGKKQDLVYLPIRPKAEYIKEGPNEGIKDSVGYEASSKAIVIGIRSQMSSVNKNSDTLMERAFAETLNLRLRIPNIVMGEVYLLPIEELDQKEMEKNKIKFSNKVAIEKFIKIFYSFSERTDISIENQYKYDSSALIFIDFKEDPPKFIYNKEDLKKYDLNNKILDLFDEISPECFENRLIENYLKFNN